MSGPQTVRIRRDGPDNAPWRVQIGDFKSTGYAELAFCPTWEESMQEAATMAVKYPGRQRIVLQRRQMEQEISRIRSDMIGS